MPDKRPETPKLTTDAVIQDDRGRILFVRRGRDPFKGSWSFPGGFVDVGESVEDACRREVREETGVEVEIDRLLGVYSDPGRDPRGHTVSVAFLCRYVSGEAKGGDDAAEAAWLATDAPESLAFDHAKILADALRRRE